MRIFLQILLCIVLVSGVFAGQINHQNTAHAQWPEPSPMARSNNTFAFNLYQRVNGQDGNLVFSPYSITQALGMLYQGAGGTTQQQIAETLALPAPDTDSAPQALANLTVSARLQLSKKPYRKPALKMSPALVTSTTGTLKAGQYRLAALFRAKQPFLPILMTTVSA
jgi:hypothetical protein